MNSSSAGKIVQDETLNSPFGLFGAADTNGVPWALDLPVAFIKGAWTGKFGLAPASQAPPVVLVANEAYRDCDVVSGGGNR